MRVRDDPENEQKCVFTDNKGIFDNIVKEFSSIP